MTNDFATIGFLADQPEDRANRRARFAEHFDTCDRLSRDATSVTRYLAVQRLPQHQTVAVALWMRCVSSGQGTVLLAERGMPAEAAALLRASLESLFWSVALLKDPEALQWLADNDRAETRKAANGMLGHKQVVENLTDADRETLLAKGATERVDTKKVAAVAKHAELDYLYESAYRGLSRMGVHAGLGSAVFSIQDNRLTFAPSDDQLPLILAAVVQGLGEGLKRFGAFAQHLSGVTA